MSKPDLNLFVIFDVIMQEQSISAAAKRLFMTQPSVSNAVSRMRQQWSDALFVKQGRGIKATPYAEQLWLQISDPLNTISQAINPLTFIPAITKQRFRIALTDGMTSALWLPLRTMLEQQAPGIDIHAVPFRGDGERLLVESDVDIVLDSYAGDHKLIHSQWMSDLQFVCVMRPDHELASTALDLDNFLAAEHLFVSLSGDAQGIVDSQLAKLNHSRRIAMTVNSFSAAFPLIAGTNLICVLPEPTTTQALQSGAVIVKKVPLLIPDVKIYISWHNRQNRDPALHWLISQLKQIYAQVV